MTKKELPKVYLLQQPSDITMVLTAMMDVSLPHGYSIELLREMMNSVGKLIHAGEMGKMNWQAYIISIGAICLRIRQERNFFKKSMKLRMPEFYSMKFADFLIQKHIRYSAAPLLRWRELGLVLRMDSKIARIEGIMDDPSLNNGDNDKEAIQDTVEDLIGYSVLGYYLTRMRPDDKGNLILPPGIKP